MIKKVLMAAEKYRCNTIVFGGGVTCNQKLRQMFQEANPHLNYVWPPKGLSLDNAAMIAGLGYHCYIKQGKGSPMDLEASTEMPF